VFQAVQAYTQPQDLFLMLKRRGQ